MTDPISPTAAQPSYTFEFLSEWFVYDTNSPSCLSWRKSPNWRKKVGDHCGTFNGYYQVQIMGKFLACHRIVLILNGFAPEAGQVTDHINRNPRDNRLENLRWVSINQNNQNKLAWSKTRWKFAYLTGYGKYQAKYKAPGENRQVYCGVYATPYKAHLAAITHRLKHCWRI